MKFIDLNRKLKRMNLVESIHFLRARIQMEKPGSIMRGELEAMLRDAMTRQLKRELAA